MLDLLGLGYVSCCVFYFEKSLETISHGCVCAWQRPFNIDSCTWECNSGYYQYGLGCFPCSTSVCDVGKYRSKCSGLQDGQCIPCSNKPNYSAYVGSGTPFDFNNCEFQCSPGYFLTNGSCQQCSTQLCQSGEYRSQCVSQQDGQCVPCTNGPLSGKILCSILSIYLCLYHNV
jgi:hypothetical protein